MTTIEHQTETWIPEIDLAERLGVTLNRIREARMDIVPETNFKKKGRRVLLDPVAVELLTVELSVPSPALEKKERGPEVEIVVKKVPLNPRIVVGVLEGESVRVRVKDSRKFIPGMRMRARQVGDGVFALVGRGPRFKGRW